MSLIATHISISYGPIAVLADCTFHVQEGERVGLAGANGSGKSTLLKIVAGLIAPDEGQVTFTQRERVGYLAQESLADDSATVAQVVASATGEVRSLETRLRALERLMQTSRGAELEAALAEYGDVLARFEQLGGYDLDHRVEEVLAGLGLSHLPREQAFGTLSGGERARVQLAALLLEAPDILLLDEPTNHLDFASAEWLEGYLTTYRGAAVVVSHDRQFLNLTVTRMLDLDEHTHALTEYAGNYDAYHVARERERVDRAEAYERQREEMRELERTIKVKARNVGHDNRAPRDNDKFAPFFFAQRQDVTVSRNVRNARERLERIRGEAIPKPAAPLTFSAQLDLASLRSDTVLRLDHVSKSFEDRLVLDDVSLKLGARDRAAIVGPNGVGKSTILNLVAGLMAPDSGEVYVHPRARIGYLDQDARTLDRSLTLKEAYRQGLEGSEAEVLNSLFRYGLFRHEDLDKRVPDLSSGQRRKLQLARMLAQGANVLLLDEPTNHLSFDVVEELERALADFPGPIIAVSHDRWFAQRFRGRVLQLRDGCLI